MRRVKNANAIKSTKFKTENKTILKLKEMVKEFRNKNLFYLEHSKFATYVPNEYLSVFKEEVVEFSKAWIRMQQKNMSSEKNPGIEGHANTRGLHVMDTAVNAEIVAEELQLNKDLAFIGGLIHDIAHTSFAHEGEHFLSEYLEKNGICEIHHSSLARLLLEIEGIHQNVLKRIEEKKGRPLTKRELKSYKSAFLSISDIAVCHNGEGGLTEVAINRNKTDKDVEDEYIRTFVEKGLDRKTRNRTKEGAVVLFCDPISYVAKDFRDGIFKKIVNVNDSEYEDLFMRLGLTKEQLDKWSTEGNKKDKIVAWVTRRLRDNLVENSRGIDGIKMERDVASLMYELRRLNYEKAVKPGLRKINDILPERTEQLIDKYSDMLIKYESDETPDDLQLNRYNSKMLKKFTAKKRDTVEEIYEKIVRQGIAENVKREVDDVLNGTKENITNRRTRIEEDIAKLKNNGEITENVKQAYINRLLKEIALSPEESKELLTKRIKLKYPDANDTEIDELKKKNENLRLQTYAECLAKLKVAIYVGESSNDFFLDMLQAEGLISEEEMRQRYELGADPEKSSIRKTIKIQQEEQAEKNRKNKNSGEGR